MSEGWDAFATAVADVLPQAAGVALSPVPIVAVVLMVMSARASRVARASPGAGLTR